MGKLSFLVISAFLFFFTSSKSLPSQLPVHGEKLVKRIKKSDLANTLNVHSFPFIEDDSLFVTGHQEQMTTIKGPPHPPLNETLPGRYLSLANITSSFPSPIDMSMEGCPDSIEILHVASVSNEGPNVYEIEYSSGLRVNNQACFNPPGAPMGLKLYPTYTNTPDKDDEMSFPIWVGLIPENMVQCGPEPGPKITVSVINAQVLLSSFSFPTLTVGLDEKMRTHSNWSLVVSLDDSVVCPYLVKSDIMVFEELVHKAMEAFGGTLNQDGDNPGAPTMNPEKILHSHFELKQLCPCNSRFPKTISFLPAMTSEADSEVEMHNGKNMNRAIKQQDLMEEQDDADDDEPERLPMPIKWNGSLCPSKSVYSIGDVVSIDYKMLNNDSSKVLMLHGVVEKLFDEMRHEISNSPSVTFSFEEKRKLLMKFGVGLEGVRGVVPFRGGSKCGVQNIAEDFVLLFEVYHILHQLSNNHIKKLIGKAKWDEILKVETMSRESASLHVFALNKSNDLDVCSYTASLRTRELLAGNCASFVPLGKRDPENIVNRAKKTTASREPTKDDPNNSSNTDHDTENGNRSEGDKEKNPMISPGSSPSNGTRDSNREQDQSGSNDVAPTVSPSETPSPILPTVTPSSSLVASPTASSSVTPMVTVETSSSSSPSVSSTQVISSGSITPSPSSSMASSSPSSDTDDSESACFPGAARVILKDGSFISMAELRIGDYIIDGSGESSRVLAFAHANPDVEHTFVLIKFDGGALPISAQHYLSINGVLTTAESAKVGDFITVLKGYQSLSQFCQSALVTGVERKSMTGLYNPQTASGSIAVVWNGSAVVTSTYTRAVHPPVAHLMLWPLRWLDRVAGVVVPLLRHVLRDGSILWKQLLPDGSAQLKL